MAARTTGSARRRVVNEYDLLREQFGREVDLLLERLFQPLNSNGRLVRPRIVIEIGLDVFNDNPVAGIPCGDRVRRECPFADHCGTRDTESPMQEKEFVS